MTKAPHNWEIIGRQDPFYGVITHEDFRKDKVDDDTRRRFYESGVSDIRTVLSWFDQDLGGRPAPDAHALDIGCGVGRLCCAIATEVGHVTGYDVSDAMVAKAREAAVENMSLTTKLPAGPFDWINSYIVFQHIPTAEGLALLDRCLAAAAPGAFLSLHFTAWRNDGPPPQSPLARAKRGLHRLIARRFGKRAELLIDMHDYNLSDVLQRIVTRGAERLVLRHTDHNGHHGVWVLARLER